MRDRRPRVPEDAFTTVEELASEQGKTTSEMLVEMIRAYNDAEYANGVLSENNRLLKEIHGSLTIQSGGSRGNAVKKSESASVSTSLDIDYNALSVGHDVAIPRDSEDWERLWSENIIKHRPQYLIPVVQGLINDMYPDGATHMPVSVLRLLLSDFGLSENTIEKYVSEYGEEFESWFVGYIYHKQFRPDKVRIEALERMAETKRDSAVALEGYREQYESFESLYEEDSFSFDSESMLFPDEVFEWVESEEGDHVPLLKFEEFVMFAVSSNMDMLVGLLDMVIDGVFNTGGVVRARLEVLAEHMLMHLAEHREHVGQNYLEAFENDVGEWASDEYIDELREAMVERALV